MKATCAVCGEQFEARRGAKTCSELCRKRKQRGGEPVDLPAGSSTTVAAVRAELEAAGRVETYLGAAALALAERIDASTAVMGFAALVKQLQATMDAATAGAKVTSDPLDELRARRERKLDAG